MLAMSKTGTSFCFYLLHRFIFIYEQSDKKAHKTDGRGEILTWLHPHLPLSPPRCDICCVTFRTHRGLLRHNALVHKQLPRDAVGRPFIQNNPSIAAGFHDLGFTDFSCRKFPWISQVRASARSPGRCPQSRTDDLPHPVGSFPEPHVSLAPRILGAAAFTPR